MDILFNLRASVGLIVRAPKPVACALPGIMETLLLLDDGVFDNWKVGLAGDLAVLTGVDGVWSGVPLGVKNCSCADTLLGGGCINLVLLYRLGWKLCPSETFGLAAGSGLSTAMLASLRPACARLGLRCGCVVPSKFIRTPGPTDFRGERVAPSPVVVAGK